MKIFVSILVLLVSLALLTGLEVWWRLDHSPAGVAVAPSTGGHVAQERSLPEGSELPYSQGVFVRRYGIPLWVTSRLVFAGYCKSDVRLAWPTPKQLTVSCVVDEGGVFYLPPPDGITVIHDSGAK